MVGTTPSSQVRPGDSGRGEGWSESGVKTRVACAVFVSSSVLMLASCSGGGATSEATGAAATAQPAASAAAPSNPDAGTSGGSARTAAPAPSPGTTLATAQGGGRVNVVSNWQGRGFTVVDSVLDGDTDDSTLQAYDAAGNALAKLPAGSFTGECGAADVVTPRGRLLLAEKDVHHDAQGIQSATDTLTLSAYDATTGRRVWITTLIRDTTSGISCTAYDGYLGSQSVADSDFTVTFDGRWGVYQPDDRYDLSHSIAIDLTTGKLYPKPGLYGTLGNWVTIAKMSTDENAPASLTLATPGTWSTFGAVTFGDGAMFEEVPGPVDQTLVPPGAQLPSNNPDSPTPAAMTPDGKTLIGVAGNGSQGANTSTVAYALPTMKKLWSIPSPQGTTYSVAAVDNSIVVLQNEVNGDSATQLTAYNVQTGASVWKQNIQSTATVCDLTSTQLVVLANDQLAFLSAADGHQSSYQTDDAQDTSGGATCPSLLGGGVTGLGLDGTAVVQLATP